MTKIMLWWTLKKIKSAKEKTRSRAARKLGKSRDARAVQPLIAMLGNENAYMRATIALVLGEICDLRSIQPLLAILNDEDADARDAAALALGMIRDMHTGDRLAPLLKGKDSATQMEAEEKLKESGSDWANQIMTS